MHLAVLCMFFALLFPLLLTALALTLSARSTNSREKQSPFECGFDPHRSARLPFSTRFFLLAVIFLVFDVEVVILLPTVSLLATEVKTSLLLGTLPFLLLVTLGLLHEWHEGSLDWSPLKH